MPAKKTIASIVLTLRHALDRLGDSAREDLVGFELIHDIKNLLAAGGDSEAEPPTRAELAELTDAAARLHKRINDYLDGRRIARVANMLPDSTRPPAGTVAKIWDALEGPNAGPEAETLESCPACRHCLLCGDRRFVPVSTASEWRRRNLPRNPVR